MSDLTKLSLTEVVSRLESDFTAEKLNASYLGRIEKYNPELNAFITVNATDRGIPVAIKDIISTKGIKTTAASKILQNYVPPFDATVVSRLAEHGINTIGKANLDEFAMGSSGENSAYGVTKNPWDKTKVPGGSSSGSAVAVAADLAVFALGTDTGGSIRQPASLTGVVGFKPSYGVVSRYGLISMASSLDQPGTFTKTVADAKLVMDWIQGSDGYDSNVIEQRIDFTTPGLNDLKGIKIGVPGEYFQEGLDERVERTIKSAIAELEKLGAEITEISLPNTSSAIAVYYIIMASEVSSNLARFSGIRYGGERSDFGDEVKRRIMLGTFALSTGYFDDYFIKAAQVRTLIKQDFEKAFSKCDLIVGPVSPTVAWGLGEKVNDPLKMYLSDTYTIPASLAGLPGVSVPCGFVDGLPVGLQILGPYLGDKKVLDVAEVYEQATDWHKEKPKL